MEGEVGMTTKIEWPLNEPIATERKWCTAQVLLHENCLLFGVWRDSRNNISSATWYETGEAASLETPNLIPPKREPRTADVWIQWLDSGGYEIHRDRPVQPHVRYTYHHIVHTDDREPITLEDVRRCFKGNHGWPENVMALLKERGYE